jgi:hypothetical protein
MKEEREDGQVDVVPLEDHVLARRSFLNLRLLRRPELDLLLRESQSRKKLLKAVREFRGYIEANLSFITNYGDRYRHGEKISTAFVESTVN